MQGTDERARDARDPWVGRCFHGRFEVVELVASGAMGRVYRAIQQPLGREVALKILSPSAKDMDLCADFEKRFLLEATICSKLSHPNTITVFDFGHTSDGVFYIAMELLKGRTLGSAIRSEAPFEPERALHIARQICRSLREAHGRGIVHRDLKPANVFLVEHDDDPDFVKVLDFGLLKDSEAEEQEQTQAGLFLGSPRYVAPEQIRGESVDGRVDVYALGVILYEMLTRRSPFSRGNTMTTLLAHLNEPAPCFAEAAPELFISPALEDIVRACLAKDRNKRTASMQELLSALKREANDDRITLTGISTEPEPRARLGTPESVAAPPRSSHRRVKELTPSLHVPRAPDVPRELRDDSSTLEEVIELPPPSRMPAVARIALFVLACAACAAGGAIAAMIRAGH